MFVCVRACVYAFVCVCVCVCVCRNGVGVLISTRSVPLIARRWYQSLIEIDHVINSSYKLEFNYRDPLPWKRSAIFIYDNQYNPAKHTHINAHANIHTQPDGHKIPPCDIRNVYKYANADLFKNMT